MKRSRLALVGLAVLSTSTLACRKASKNGAEDGDFATLGASSAPLVVPPAAPFNATPVASVEGGGDLDKQPPYEQAKVFQANGQLWMGRLVLERKALGEGGTKDELELLARICQDQGDAACVELCGKKLGRKIKMTAAAPSTVASGPREHAEPDTELARARDLVLRMQFEPARKTLEPKVLDGKASRSEIRLLRVICEKQGDRMCVALCDSKLK